MIHSRPVRLLRHLSPYVAAVLGIAILALFARVLLHFPGTAILPAECALVFGAAVHRGDDPGPGILRRTTTAARLVRNGTVGRLILTGGTGGGNAQSEAAVMQTVALLQGVAPENIVLEQESTSTSENLRNSRPLLQDCTSVIAISDRYHLARIAFLAEQQGYPVLPTYPADGPIGAFFLTRSVLREAIALLYYAAFPPKNSAGE
jgi:uncharacterized SAM-binding protein YcdF (DUF218 family)